jgi:hypothetical protein
MKGSEIMHITLVWPAEDIPISRLWGCGFSLATLLRILLMWDYGDLDNRWKG